MRINGSRSENVTHDPEAPETTEVAGLATKRNDLEVHDCGTHEARQRDRFTSMFNGDDAQRDAQRRPRSHGTTATVLQQARPTVTVLPFTYDIAQVWRQQGATCFAAASLEAVLNRAAHLPNAQQQSFLQDSIKRVMNFCVDRMRAGRPAPVGQSWAGLLTRLTDIRSGWTGARPPEQATFTELATTLYDLSSLRSNANCSEVLQMLTGDAVTWPDSCRSFAELQRLVYRDPTSPGAAPNPALALTQVPVGSTILLGGRVSDSAQLHTIAILRTSDGWAWHDARTPPYGTTAAAPTLPALLSEIERRAATQSYPWITDASQTLDVSVFAPHGAIASYICQRARAHQQTGTVSR